MSIIVIRYRRIRGWLMEPIGSVEDVTEHLRESLDLAFLGIGPPDED